VWLVEESVAEELEGMTLTRRGVWLVGGVVVPGDGLRMMKACVWFGGFFFVVCFILPFSIFVFGRAAC
jgi:hypothetical protein